MMKLPFGYPLSSRRQYLEHSGFFTADLRDVQYHSFLCGVSGSGKSNALLIQRYSACRLLNSYPKQYIYCCLDAKGDALSFFNNNLSPSIPIYYFNPIDKYADVLDYGAEVSEFVNIPQIVDDLLNPVAVKGENSFWQDSTKALLKGVHASMITARGKNYQFHNIVQAIFSDFEFLLNFLSLSKQNIPIIQTLLGGASEKTRDTIFINTFVELEPLIYLASIYQRANNFASLDKVLNSKKALVILGTSQGNLALTKPINRVIMTRFFQRFQDKKTDRVGNRIRFEIDELQKQGKINGLVDALVYCRGLGIFFSLATQNMEGLEQVYGREGANTIFSNCVEKLVFRQGTEYSANFFSSFIGERQGYEINYSVNYKEEVSFSEHFYQNRKILPSIKFKSLPLSNPDDGVIYYHLHPSFKYGVKKVRIPPQIIDSVRDKIGEEYEATRWSNYELTLEPLTNTERAIFLTSSRYNYAPKSYVNLFPDSTSKEIAKLSYEMLSRAKVQEVKQKLRKMGVSLYGD